MIDVASYVDQILDEAVRLRASDIHIEPMSNNFYVRLRVDGILQPHDEQNLSYFSPVISRIKVLSGLDIGERRLPQDGSLLHKKSQDIRISTLPTVYGEKMVLRLLRQEESLSKVSQLGLEAVSQVQFMKMIQKPHGMVLVTGPTGSGKTTTLYAALNELNTRGRNITTLEDPVERRMFGINQVQVNSKIDLTFAKGLRALLRQDPDVIMIGEIRDAETAEIATRAALTGHLVFSTLHTIDAPSALTRLIEMGIEPYLVASALTGVIAQRLVRRLCTSCHSHPTDQYCSICNGTGYYGRSAVYELLTVNDELQQLIVNRSVVKDIRNYAKNKGMRTLRESVLMKVRNGETSMSEYNRVVYGEG